MAEGMLRERLRILGASGIAVHSMGTLGLYNQPASDYAQRVCAERGVDISAHRSRPLDPVALSRAGLILTMELVHSEQVIEIDPPLEERTSLLGTWPGPKQRIEDMVPDPIGRPLAFYRDIAALIERHVERVAAELVQRSRCQPPSTKST
jgi:protein-tyrosine phosphatase